MANTYLTRTVSSTGNRRTFTISTWFKRSGITGANQKIFEAVVDGSSYTDLRLKTTEALQFYTEQAGISKISLVTNRLFRDPSAFYHVVIAVDTTQGTASDRVKMYINGVQETSFSTATYPDQNYDTYVNYSSATNVIGRRNPYSDFYFDGLMSHFHLVDGTAYAPTVFGSQDATTGEWEINTSPSITMGTNGFTILKDGMTITDQSTNSNNWTLGGGTLTATKDCPHNNFATLNPLSGSSSNNTLTNGNTTVETTSGWRWRPSTIAPSLGKYYVEFKPTSGGNIYTAIGVTPESNWDNIDGDVIGYGESVGYDKDGAVYKGASSQSGSWASYTTNDIIGVAADLTNRCVYFSKNGVWQNSGDPTSGASKTGGVALSATLDNWSISTSQAGTTVACNYGNGFFGTTAITTNSGNGYAGAEGKSKFNYQPPTGYSALSTLGINQ